MNALGLMGIGVQQFRQGQQHNRQKELMDVQFKNQQRLNQQGHDLQMKMWRETNYPAQMDMLREAGLNPALLYGQGGAGGSTTGSQGGGSAASGSAQAPMDIGSILQAGMLKAQIDNLNADTELKKSGATKTETETTSILQGIENQKAQESLTKAQSRLQTILGDIQEDTKEWQIKGEMYNVRKTIAETENTLIQNGVDRETAKDKARLLSLEVIGQGIENNLKRKGIEKTDKEIEKITNDIIGMYVSLGQGQQKINIDKFKEEIKAAYPSIMQVGGNLADKVIMSLEQLEEWLTGLKPIKKEIK